MSFRPFPTEVISKDGESIVFICRILVYVVTLQKTKDITMIPLLSFFSWCFGIFFVSLFALLAILTPIVAIKAILKDGKARRRMEKRGQQSNTTTG